MSHLSTEAEQFTDHRVWLKIIDLHTAMAPASATGNGGAAVDRSESTWCASGTP